MKLLCRVPILHFAIMTLYFGAAAGSSYSPVHLRRCVTDAGVIAAGTVEAITPRKMDGAIVSDIRFRDVVFLRDSRTNTKSPLVIYLLGGRLADEELIDAGAPKLRIGERYVLMLKTKLGTYRDAYTPIVYFNQGLFPVYGEAGSAQRSVHDWMRRPIAGVHNGRIISVQPRDQDACVIPKEPRSAKRALSVKDLGELASKIPEGVPVIELANDIDPGLRLSEEQFLGEIRNLMTGR